MPKPFLLPPHQVSTSILWFATHSAAPLLPTQTSKFGVVVFFLQGDVALGCREMAGVGLATVPLPKQCSRFRSAVCMFIKAKCSWLQPEEPVSAKDPRQWGASRVLQPLSSCGGSPRAQPEVPPAKVTSIPPSCPSGVQCPHSRIPAPLEAAALHPPVLPIPAHTRSQQCPGMPISSPGTLQGHRTGTQRDFPTSSVPILLPN